ncbi:MAG: hypothetical protein ABS33_06455, partial [Verrucomicrobia subdivision 6 bacterium BACL9 MAG-120924-bin69]
IFIGNSVYLQTLATNQLGTNVSIRWNVINNANYGYFVLMGQNQTVGNLDPGTDAASAVIENTESETSVGNSILTVHQTSDLVFPGFIRNTSTGSGTLGLVKDGSGKLTLTGANITYTGTTTVNEGTLVLSNATAYASASTVQGTGILRVSGSIGPGASITVTNGGTVEGSGEIPSLSIRSNGLVKIGSASTNSAGAWDTGGTISFSDGSKIDVTGLSLSQQPYVLIRGSSVSGTPILQGATGFTVANSGNSITLTPVLDSDGDGLNDGQEIVLGTNPNLADTDGDGVPDGQETALGSSPTDAMSMPKTKVVYWGQTLNTNAAANIPTNLPSDIVKISAGGTFAVALSSAGRVYAWGNSTNGVTNVPPGATSGVVDVVAGLGFVYARKTNNTIVAWGDSRNLTNLPSNNIIKIVAGRDQGLLLDSTGKVTQRGPNNSGTANVNTDSNWQSGVTDIGAAIYNHIALKNGAAIVTGIANHNARVVPTEAASNVKSVYAHGGSTLTAILSNNQIVMWGKNDTVQVVGLKNLVDAGSLPGVTVTRYATGTQNDAQLVLSQSNDPTIRKFFSTHGYWTGLLDRDGKLHAWGASWAVPNSPVPAAMASNVVAAAGGENFALALVLDQDGDGLADNVETGTDTYVSVNNTGTDPLDDDSDNDGLNDGEEVITYGTNPVSEDTDGDGVNDKAEVDYGTSPTVSTVFNRLINGSFEDGTEKPSPGGNLPTHQDNVPGWKTTAN